MHERITALDWPYRTERLVLRLPTPDDAKPTWEYRSRDEVARWMGAHDHDLEEYTQAFLDERRHRMIVIERDGEVIGDLMLKMEDGWAQLEVADQARAVQAEIGWALHPDHQGHGYAAEAIRELLRICFAEAGLRRVIALCFTDNVASWRLMEKLGMRREQHAVRESLHRSGEWLDSYGYAMLADEWPR